MKWPAWLSVRFLRTPAAKKSLTLCPTCGQEMRLVDRSSMSGDDMRSYRCDRCQKEHIVDFGIATWKAMSDARESDK
jgi:predicted RNA-binding Zn-ribbon protein involved in translation (DUF1610 family)